MKLQLFLSHNGVCSRRRALELIQKGIVSVNGQVVHEPSIQIDPVKDKIQVSSQFIPNKTFTYVVLNKPGGYVTTKSDRFAEKTVVDLLPQNLKHLVPVGRLDKDTEGLLLLTNDGEVNYRLTHPKFNIAKTYLVRINGKLNLENKKRLEQGILIEGQRTAPAKVNEMKFLKDTTEFLMIIHEGRKRQIRLMVEAIGHKVLYLKRIAQGPLSLGNLKTGQWRKLSEEEINQLKKCSNSPVSQQPR